MHGVDSINPPSHIGVPIHTGWLYFKADQQGSIRFLWTMSICTMGPNCLPRKQTVGPLSPTIRLEKMDNWTPGVQFA